MFSQSVRCTSVTGVEKIPDFRGVNLLSLRGEIVQILSHRFATTLTELKV